jgi:Asp-tRNA(Asn)/Glu-tRNA(Gln) amidotransferase A subunit family amidase
MAASHALAMGGALLRRFCSCNAMEPCRCGLKPSRSGWSVEALMRLRALVRELRSVSAAASRMGRTVHDCNRALDVLIARTPTHALAVLEAQSTRKWREARKKPAVRWTSCEQAGIKTGTAKPI